MLQAQRMYGWRPQLPDFRDYQFEGVAPPETLPPYISLRTLIDEIYDQGQTNSCTGNAIAQAMRITQVVEKFTPIIPPSRMFIYYNERLKEGYPTIDNGADLRDGMKVAADLGAGNESYWTFSSNNLLVKPAPGIYQNAVQNMIKTYAAVNQDLNSLKQVIAGGYPFVFGFSVYESFESTQVSATGIVPLPAPNEQQLGGHAVCATGYDDKTQTFEVVNSWGPNWGDKGFFYLPYSYITNPNLAGDFWTISMLETQNDPNRKWKVPK